MDTKNNNQIVVGMSGGVDSSVAATILKRQGWNPVGVSLKLKNSDTKKSFSRAICVCKKLNIPHYIIDARLDFKKIVVDYFIDSYKKNLTPNPCVVCNPNLKFKFLFDFAHKHEIKYVATGHYARIQESKKTRKQKNKKAKKQESNFLLSTAKDKTKDQSYYLAFLPQKWLGFIKFPLGNYTKQEVYKLARENRMDFFNNTKQSQDFCFLQDISLNQFLNKKIKPKPGLIKDIQGHTMGRHQGLYTYTLGQRKGIGLSGGPYYVVRFDTNHNILIVSKNKQDLYSREALLSGLHFISDPAPKKPIKVKAKIRYQHQASPATLIPISSAKAKLIFTKPQPSITPGQFAVFYQSQTCLGGGVII